MNCTRMLAGGELSRTQIQSFSVPSTCRIRSTLVRKLTNGKTECCIKGLLRLWYAALLPEYGTLGMGFLKLLPQCVYFFTESDSRKKRVLFICALLVQNHDRVGSVPSLKTARQDCMSALSFSHFDVPPERCGRPSWDGSTRSSDLVRRACYTFASRCIDMSLRQYYVKTDPNAHT